MDLRDAFMTAMVFLTIAVPVSITCILTVMLRIAAGGGLPRRMNYPPPGVAARADEVAARMRAHLQRRRQAPDPEPLQPAGSLREVPTVPLRERRRESAPGAAPRAA